MPHPLTISFVDRTRTTLAEATERRAACAIGQRGQAAVMSDLMGAVATPSGLDAALSAITAAALVLVPGTAYAAIACPAGYGLGRTRASTDILVDSLDLLQDTFRQGPCANPREHAVTTVADIVIETRWPRFTAAAARLGVTSMLSIAFFGENGAFGALNLYATTDASFTIDDEIITAVLAADAAAVLAAASACDVRGSG